MQYCILRGFCVRVVSSMVMRCFFSFVFFFLKQKTAYEMRISDWSSDVCSSDLVDRGGAAGGHPGQQPRYLWRAGILRDRRCALERVLRGQCPQRRPAGSPLRRGHARPWLGTHPVHLQRIRAEPPHGDRTEERRGGKEGVRKCQNRGSPDQSKKKKNK